MSAPATRSRHNGQVTSGDDVLDDVERKSQFRRLVRDERRALANASTATERDARARQLADTAMAHPVVAETCRHGGVVTCFASLPTEPPTEVLLAALSSAGGRVLLPLVRPGRSLHWAWHLPGDPLEAAALGIGEPVGEPAATTPDELLELRPRVLVMPALAVDRSHSRLGQGGGYYDTLLAALPRHLDGGPLRLVLVGPTEVWAAHTIPTDDHDQPIDEWCVV